MKRKYNLQEKLWLNRCFYMKWHFLIIALLAAIQGAVLSWNEWMQWRDLETMRTSADGSSEVSIICGSGSGAWPPIVAISISIIIFVLCLHRFFKLNSTMPIQGRKLRILTRP